MPRPSNPQEAMQGFLSGDDPGFARMRRLMRHVCTDPTASSAPHYSRGQAAQYCDTLVSPGTRQPSDLQFVHQESQQARGFAARRSGSASCSRTSVDQRRSESG